MPVTVLAKLLVLSAGNSNIKISGKFLIQNENSAMLEPLILPFL